MSAIHRIHHDAIAELRLDNPAKLNAFTPAMLDSLEAHLAAIEADPAIRFVILTAEGERAFVPAPISMPGAIFRRGFCPVLGA
nr:enoyl-CoA hydratase/isomerase family protein [Marinicella sp. W31]MDC2879317.1 enoyl-CoA hydratase-related protein [Marinicella sp. W31]